MQGKIIVYLFWTTKFSILLNIPYLNKIRDEYKNDSDVVFLAITPESAEDITAFLKTQYFNYDIIDGGMDYIRKNNIRRVPVYVVADREGKVRFHCSSNNLISPLWIKRYIEEVKAENFVQHSP